MGKLADAIGEGGGVPGEGGHEFVVGVCEAGGVVDPGTVEASALQLVGVGLKAWGERTIDRYDTARDCALLTTLQSLDR